MISSRNARLPLVNKGGNLNSTVCDSMLQFYSLSVWREHKVPVTHIHLCHLLDYEQHLLSLVLSHCHYSLKLGEGQNVRYDHGALEKSLLDRFIHGKPVILTDIPQAVYLKDICTAPTFAAVRKMVYPQVCCVSAHYIGYSLVLCSGSYPSTSAA